MTVHYDPQEMQISFLLRFKGTIFPLVFSDPMFWFLIIVHLILLKWDGDLLAEGGEGLPPLDWNASTVAMGLLTFFLVFYGNHCYSRYFELFGHCVAIGKCVMIWAHLVQFNFPHCSAAVRWNMMRLILGGMHLHYADCRREEDHEGRELQGVSKEEFRAMRRSNLFTRSEITTLDKYRGYKSIQAVTWSLQEVRIAILKGWPEKESGPLKSKLTTMPQLTIFSHFERVAEELITNFSQTQEILNQPVPFPYFHVLKLLLLVALLILSYAMIELLYANVFLSLTCYTVACIIMIGLEQIAIGMSDPFGLDEVDFELDNFLQVAYDNAIAKLTDARQPQHEVISVDMDNPLEKTLHAQELRSWADLGVGLQDDRPTPRGGDPKPQKGDLPNPSSKHLPPSRRLPAPGGAVPVTGAARGNRSSRNGTPPKLLQIPEHQQGQGSPFELTNPSSQQYRC